MPSCRCGRDLLLGGLPAGSAIACDRPAGRPAPPCLHRPLQALGVVQQDGLVHSRLEAAHQRLGRRALAAAACRSGGRTGRIGVRLLHQALRCVVHRRRGEAASPAAWTSGRLRRRSWSATAVGRCLAGGVATRHRAACCPKSANMLRRQNRRLPAALFLVAVSEVGYCASTPLLPQIAVQACAGGRMLAICGKAAEQGPSYWPPAARAAPQHGGPRPQYMGTPHASQTMQKKMYSK